MKKELEQLIFDGELSNTITLLGKVWTLRTISSEEHKEIIKKINSNNDRLNLALFKIECVTRSLVSIDNITIDNYDEKIEFINKLPFNIVDKLFTVYDELNIKLNNTLNDETIKELKN